MDAELQPVWNMLLTAKKGGLVTQCHNEIRDVIGDHDLPLVQLFIH